MYITLLFDVEDLVTPESDNIVKWLAEILTDEEVEGTFLVVAEKARLLERRNRIDVLEALRKHDIGSHSNTHSIHPTISEYLENKRWEEGVKEVYRRELLGFKDLERIFKKKIWCLGRPGGSYAPQLAYVLGKLGKAYVYCPVMLPNHNVAWFCGALTFARWFGGFDQTYADTEKFNEILSRLDRFIKNEHAKGTDWVGIFCCHPTMVRAYEFWDAINFAKGANPPRERWKRPKMRTGREMEIARRNFRRLVKFLKENPLVQIRTIKDLLRIYSYQPEYISMRDLLDIAVKILERNDILVDQRFSPAETLVAMAASILLYDSAGKLPEKVKRRDVIGPVETPLEKPEASYISWKDLVDISERIINHVNDKGYLPANVSLSNGKAGISSIYFAFAETLLNVKTGDIPNRIRLKPSNPYPSIAKEIEAQVRKTLSGWIIHKPDLNQEKIVEYTKLQTWTLKPAFEAKKQLFRAEEIS
ncbi:hypothetical protein DRO35_02840 [Candidatus Bathyarchaeota archaeon]|nr:MAG: hypothetical protein DRO35_02840 [Candidatus Bathyarchaeota archaeon]